MLARLHYRCSSTFIFRRDYTTTQTRMNRYTSVLCGPYADSALLSTISSALFQILRHKSAFLAIIEYQIILSVDDYSMTKRKMLCLTMNEWSKLDANLTDPDFLHLLGERGMPMRQNKTKTPEVHTTSIFNNFSKDQPFHLYFICILLFVINNCPLLNISSFPDILIATVDCGHASIRCAGANYKENSNGPWFSLRHLLTKLKSDTSKGQRWVVSLYLRVHRFRVLFFPIYYDQMFWNFDLNT